MLRYWKNVSDKNFESTEIVFSHKVVKKQFFFRIFAKISQTAVRCSLVELNFCVTTE